MTSFQSTSGNRRPGNDVTGRRTTAAASTKEPIEKTAPKPAPDTRKNNRPIHHSNPILIPSVGSGPWAVHEVKPAADTGAPKRAPTRILGTRRAPVPAPRRARTSQPAARYENIEPEIIEISVIVMLIMSTMINPIKCDDFTIPNNGSLQLANQGQVVFSTKSALLHFELDPYQLCNQIEQALKSFVNSSTLIMQLQVPQIPLLKQLMHMDLTESFKAVNEFRVSLSNLDSITKRRNKRITEWVGLGLSIFNTGWSTYLTTQIMDLSRSSSQLTHSVVNLQKTVMIQNKQLETLANTILEFQGSVYESAEILTTTKIISSLTKQIERYARELNEGIHNHRLPYTLFNPSDIDQAWNSLLDELQKQQLTPIFSDRPSQLYELNADYYVLNQTFHVLVNVPIKEISQPTLSLNAPVPTMVLMQDRLFLYDDDTLLATFDDQIILPNSIIITPKELMDCQRYGNLYCCPKNIFPVKSRSCAHELLMSNAFPSRDCLKKFILLDETKPYAIAKPQNTFDIYSPSLEQATLNCPNAPSKLINLHKLQTIILPDDCSMTSHDFKMLATSHLNFLPIINADIGQTIILSQLLNRIPEISDALLHAQDPIRQMLKPDPTTLLDIVDNSKKQSPILYILIGIGSGIVLLLILTIIFSLRKKFMRLRNKTPDNANTTPPTNTINIHSALLPHSTAQAARQIELRDLS